MQHRHFNIPIFIPHAACPHKCIFCDQKSISDTAKPPSYKEMRSIIETRLNTIPADSEIEIAFFGGTFTGIPVNKQEQYLKLANEYIDQGRISGIRMSTRPDCIDSQILRFLKKYNVTAIELGIQSTDRDVLRKAERGHSKEDIIDAARLIKESGIALGMQMMPGLPEDTYKKTIDTAGTIIGLKANTVRVYPCLVIKGTKLEELYLSGKYNPLSLEDAVSWCADLLQMFDDAGISVIKMGLHPSEGLVSGNFLTAGPFHLSFRELVLSEIWRRLLKNLMDSDRNSELLLYVNPSELNYAIGYKSCNRIMLLKKFGKVIFKTESLIRGRNYKHEHY
ncbi:MAG: radical SAM protein [Spirochaetes bacterium]|nr:radical SAM protein [Spirochaetota bacterium]